MPAPLEKQPIEPPEAYNAFCSWLQCGQDLRITAQVANVPPDQVQYWKHVYCWEVRAKYRDSLPVDSLEYAEARRRSLETLVDKVTALAVRELHWRIADCASNGRPLQPFRDAALVRLLELAIRLSTATVPAGAVSDKKVDLGKLTDEELATLERLTDRAAQAR